LKSVTLMSTCTAWPGWGVEGTGSA
jgi:hypothetical protein